MKRFSPLFILWLLTSITLSSIAQTECPALVEFALSSTNEFCTDTGRNQACFGHIDLSVEAQPDASNFEFIQMGDIVDVAQIRSLRLSTLDTSAGAWGVVLMRLQANLPDALPGQNVTFMLFGDTEIRNAATSVAEQNPTKINAQVASSINANVRVGPSSSMATISSIPNGTSVIANGISPEGEWIRIILPDSETNEQGWISSQLITTSDDLKSLQVIQPGQPQFGPMQAFYLSTGIGEPTCNEMPDDGLLVQTPKGVGEINLLVNEVEIDMGSTVFLQAPRREGSTTGNVNASNMKVITVEGAARVKYNGDTTIAVGGSQFEINYNEEGEIEEITESTSYNRDDIDDLPYENLEREFEFVEPLNEDELAILSRYDEVFGLVDIDETDDLLNYLEEFGDDNLLNYLQTDLDIDYFDGEMAEFFNDELGIEMDGFDDFDDEFDEFNDGLDDNDLYPDDEFDDGYGDGIDDGFDNYGDDSYNDAGSYDGYDDYSNYGGYDGYGD